MADPFALAAAEAAKALTKPPARPNLEASLDRLEALSNPEDKRNSSIEAAGQRVVATVHAWDAMSEEQAAEVLAWLRENPS